MIPQPIAKKKIYVKSKNHTSFQPKGKVLTHTTCYNSMSQKTSSCSSAQRYKDAILAIEGNPGKEIAVTQKRSSNIDGTSSQKKTKGKSKTLSKRPNFWLGFQAMNWTNRGKGLPMDSHEPVAVLVESGMREANAIECQSAISCFPFVVQDEWPNSREDGKKGQHYNLTQVPSDVEVDAFGFSLDYQIAIHFEMEEEIWTKDTIMDLVVARLKVMDIALGEDIGELVALMCYHKTTNWSGVIKLHLKSPQTDGKLLLQGLKPFILKLEDNKLKRGKVCRAYHSLALNNLLSVKIASETLEFKEWHEMYEQIVEEGFKRGVEYEITNIQKTKKTKNLRVGGGLLKQAKRMKEHKLTYNKRGARGEARGLLPRHGG